jgi:hypothetical protein
MIMEKSVHDAKRTDYANDNLLREAAATVCLTISNS